jgi:putative ABC transport system permease protein
MQDDFHLASAVADWRRRALASNALDAGEIAERESSLYDHYDAALLAGLPPREAFARASTKTGLPTTKAGPADLYRNYLKTGLRNLRSRAGYNLTNYACLTIGILTTALAVLYLDYEKSYDAFVPDADRKYRVGQEYRSQGYSMIAFPDYFGTDAATQRAQIDAIGAVRGVEQAIQFWITPNAQLVELDRKELATEDLLETNTPAAFLDYFGWRTLRGSAAAFSAQPNTALLTAGEAERFFGPDWRDRRLTDLTLRIDTLAYTVVGVLQDVPPNAHLDFSIALHRERIDYWGARTYVKLAPNESPTAVRERMLAGIGSINPTHAADELFNGHILQPIRSLHLQSDLLYEIKPPGNPTYLYIIGLIALIILLLTISNYTNLTVALSASRSREIGMRKVFGATDTQIAGQFMLEAVLLGVLTLPVVLLALWAVLPRFDALMGTELAAAFPGSGSLWLLLLSLSVSIGLVASLYPAFYLARTQVLSLFRGNFARTANRGIGTRKLIITAQFVLLIGLCSLALLVNQQMNFIQDKDLGYRKQNVLYVNLNTDSSRLETFRQLVEALPEVDDVGFGSPMGGTPYNQLTYKLAGTDQVYDDAYNIDFDYRGARLMDIETSVPDYLANPAEAPDRLVLINRTLAERLKNRFDLTDAELIGRTILQEPEYADEETGEVGFPYPIAGTFEDLNMFSLRERVDPTFLTLYKRPRYAYWAMIAFRGASPTDIVAKVEQQYDRLGLEQVFTHSFLADNLEELYQEERRIATLSTYFSLLAFLTAVIGLVALTAYLTALKKKEIGIRRILGAGPLDILGRFNREYLVLIGVSLLIATPLAWLGVSWWLEGFAYRVEINPLIFLLAGGITLLVTVVAVSVVTLRAVRGIPARVVGG